MDYDVLVIGSGFGGSVAALRLTEKGYRVGVLEAGRRFEDHEFAENSWHLKQFLWAPALGCYGIQRVRLLRNVLCLTGAGVGGGSLVYANTLYRPLDPFYADPAWSHITDWKTELAPYYDQAERMLGVVQVSRPVPRRRDHPGRRRGHGRRPHLPPDPRRRVLRPRGRRGPVPGAVRPRPVLRRRRARNAPAAPSAASA